MGLLIGLLFSGLPVAFAFLFINIFGTIMWMGGIDGVPLIVGSVVRNVGSFTLVAVPLFIFMGSLLFHTGLAGRIIDAIGTWVGRMPGSLSLLAVGSGTVFALMSGSSMSSVAVLGGTLVPEMKRRGYSNAMSVGPILGAGGLAMIFPPSILAILMATIAKVPVGKLLISGVIPGFTLAALYTAYILLRARFQPYLAPAFQTSHVTWIDKFKALLYIFPISIVIIFVLGFIFLGITTPSEAAATGVFATFLLAAVYRRLSWRTIKKTISETIVIASMVFMIIMGSTTFSNILAYTGSTASLVKIAIELPVHPILVVMFMQITLIVLGTFLDGLSMMMITVPIYMPVINALGYDPIWFCVLVLVNIEIGLISPPFGLSLYVMKGIVPDAKIFDIILGAMPFFLCGVILLAIRLAIPQLATWLPGLMR